MSLLASKKPPARETKRGYQGPPGISTYELALLNGFIGSLSEWLLSLKGDKGEPGLNANQIVPDSASITRDGDGNISTITMGTETITFTRSDGIITSVSNSLYTMDILRDGNGRVSGTTIVEL